ncbi:MAG: hemolysin [Flavobacteriales bacterium CG_4_9_14_3_um_filter_40_17]|nr:MAG: hemolysin [Flavobacteriales bacterium CG_4_9_14_3_um_filter_40_17]
MNPEMPIILITLLLSAFFSGMEIAFVTANKIQVEIEKKQDNLFGMLLSRITAKPSKFITTMLVGNNLSLVIYGYFMGKFLMGLFVRLYPTRFGFVNSLLTDFNLLAQTILSTLVILITAEFLPKVFFQVYANSLLKWLSFPAYVIMLLLSIPSELIMKLTDWILKYIFKTSGDAIQLTFTKMELGHYINEQIEKNDNENQVDSEIQIFQNALEFSEIKAREIMVPRTEIEAVDIQTPVADVVKILTETGYSKILIYKENIDDIIGYIHSFDLFKKPKNITSILKPIEFIPETMLTKDILDLLIKKRKSIAVVLDEYGGTAGLITLEDIVEELFGEIEDEHDVDELIEIQIDETFFKFSARLEVDYINEVHKLDLPEDENYETLGGLIVNYTEEIPQINEVVQIDKYQFTILEASNTKIDLVTLKILKSD